MIEWNKIEDEIYDEIVKVEDDCYDIKILLKDTISKAVTNYFKSLIAKEFKLVAKGVVMTNSKHIPFIGIIEDNHVRDKFLPLCNPTELRVGDNISIYISEEK